MALAKLSRIVLVVSAVVALLSQTSFAQAVCGRDMLKLALADSKVAVLLLLFPLLLLFLVAVAYMLARASNEEKFELILKEELAHIALFFALLFISEAVFFLLCAGMGNNPQTALDFVQRLDYSQRQLLISMNQQSVEYMVHSSKFVYFGWLISSGKGSLTNTAATNRANHYLMESAIEFVVPAQISINIQKIILSLIIDPMFVPVMLLVGTFIKLFPMIRDFGNAFIGIGIAAYVVIPFIYSQYAVYSGAVNSFLFSGDYSKCSRVDNPVFKYESFARYFPEAFFLPNIAIALCVMGIDAVMKGMRMVDRWVESMTG